MKSLYLFSALVSGALVITGCVSTETDEAVVAPLVFVPGLGMSTLQVDVVDSDGESIQVDFLVPSMTPVELLPGSAPSALAYSIDSGLPESSVDQVADWLALDIDAEGMARNKPGVTAQPVSVGENFELECPRYVPMIDELESFGWIANANAYCAPFDYRFTPGSNSFVSDFMKLVERVVDASSGAKAAVACHSQGCLMAYHALRTIDAEWINEHVAFLFGFAGQFSGCSDCLLWAAQTGWSWDPNAPDATPVDPTWVGEMALGLQESVYGQEVLYRLGGKNYQAMDSAGLLVDIGAASMARAQDRYALGKQQWFRQGSEMRQPLGVPTRFVFGNGIPTTYGYDLNGSNMVELQTDGDGGDSQWMNQAPLRWTADVDCDVLEIPGVGHMEIVTNGVALAALSNISTSQGKECLSG